MAGSLLVEDLAPGIRALVVSNPARKNAIDGSLLEALDAALRSSDGVRAWLVRSDDAAVFSAGYDLTALGSFPPDAPLPDERLGEVLDRLMHHPAPSVAVVRGPAIGAGCELAAACDFRVGDATARFSLPPAKLGVVYALKGLARVASRVGLQAARRMFLLGRAVAADEALRLGLLDAVAADAPAEALALCHELTAAAPLAVRGMKRGLELVAAGELSDADYERTRRASFNSEDAREGRDALLERRAPRFLGK
jgi:enoyl-CoA hydratase/carnithine racemase